MKRNKRTLPPAETHVIHEPTLRVRPVVGANELSDDDSDADDRADYDGVRERYASPSYASPRGYAAACGAEAHSSSAPRRGPRVWSAARQTWTHAAGPSEMY